MRDNLYTHRYLGPLLVQIPVKNIFTFLFHLKSSSELQGNGEGLEESCRWSTVSPHEVSGLLQRLPGSLQPRQPTALQGVTATAVL